MARGCALALLLGLCAARAALAEDVRVVSPAPDEVSVTIYRDLFALIAETRTVDLPAEPVTLVFDGVVDSLLAQSAVVADTGRSVAESNFDFERLTPANLLRNSVGRQVTLTRTHPGTGKATQVAATIVSANSDGVVFRSVDGNEALYCSGLPERLGLDEIPAEISAAPSLSIRLAAGTAGKRRVRVSYLAHGLAWNADYVGTIGSDSARMDLLGWVTLRNLTGATFRAAQVQVVAGRLNLLDQEDGGTSLVGDTANYSTDDELFERLRDEQEYLEQALAEHGTQLEILRGCYPQGPAGVFADDAGALPDQDLAEPLRRIAVMNGMELEEIVVTGFRGSMAVRENLADYQLYRLPAPTDLNARQSKQIAFIHKSAVRIERFYGLRFADDEDYDEYAGEDERIRPSVRIAWVNSEADGLGEPLPGGRVRIFEQQDGAMIFAGEADMRDTAAGAPVEFPIGAALDLTLRPTLPEDEEPEIRWTSLLTRRAYFPVEWLIENDKPAPVMVELRQGPVFELRDIRIKGASLAPQRKAGDYMWRVTVPALGAVHLSYTLSGRSAYAD